MALAHYLTFAIFALIAVAGALGMTTTMSMFRSAIFLMASFIGVGGLFVLLMADLLGLLQVMMYIGGMLVMALFMVLFSGGPGGKMMTGMMDLPLVERFFSSGLVHDHDGDGDGDDHDMEMEPMFIVQHKTPAAILAGVVWVALSSSESAESSESSDARRLRVLGALRLADSREESSEPLRELRRV